MAQQINQPVAVDTYTGTHFDGRTNGTVSSILTAQDKTKAYSTTQAQNLQETAKAMQDLEKNIASLLKTLEGSSSSALKTKEFKEFQKAINGFNESFADAQKILDKGTTDIVTLTKTVEKSNNAFDEASSYYALFNGLINKHKNVVEDLTEVKKKEFEQDKADLRHRKEIRSRQSKEIINTAKEGSKELAKAFQEGASKLSSSLSKIHTAFRLDELTTNNARSASAEIQLGIQNSFGLSRKEFNSFKKDMYGQINTSIYSAADVRQAIATLEHIGINNTAEAIDKIDTIIQGQQLLGMNAEQQAKLQQYGNRTGRDSLTFQTNRMAKWMTMSTNIGKKQLSELVDLNTNLLTQFADLGITSQEFEATNTANNAALVALTGDSTLSGYYNKTVTDLASDMTAPAAALGMSVGDYKKFLEQGGSFFDLVDNGKGLYGDLYNQYLNNPEYVKANLPALTTDRGIDSSTAALIMKQAEYDREHGRGSFTDYANNYNVAGDDEAIKSLEEKQAEATDAITKFVNNFTNTISSAVDWITASNFSGYMKWIITLLEVIANKDLLNNGLSLFGGKGKGLGNKMFGKGSWLGGTKGVSWKNNSWGNGAAGVMSKVGGVLGVISTGADLIGGATTLADTLSTREGGPTGWDRVGYGIMGAFSGTDVATKSTGHEGISGKIMKGLGMSENTAASVKNIGGGLLSGAGKGAAIGGLFGPVGMAIGAGVGAIGGLIGGIIKDSKRKKQEKLQEEQAANTEKIAQNTETTAKILGDTRLSTSQRSIQSVRSYTGGSSSPGHAEVKSAYMDYLLRNGLMSLGDLSKFTGAKGQMAGPWQVTSPYGNRKDPGTGKNQFHHGIDLSWGGTQQIYASHAGVVKHVNHGAKQGYGPYGVYITSPDGKIEYQYGHMKARFVKDGQYVTAGTHIGTMGDMGYSFGQHLHYQVNKNGSSTSPVPYVNKNLWTHNGTNNSAINYSSGVQSSTSEDNSSIFKTRVSNFTSGTGDGVGLITNGLAEIKQTLLDLSARQSRDEQILTMLQGTKKQDPRIA